MIRLRVMRRTYRFALVDSTAFPAHSHAGVETAPVPQQVVVPAYLTHIGGATSSPRGTGGAGGFLHIVGSLYLVFIICNAIFTRDRGV